MHSIRVKAFVKVIKGPNAGRCGRVISRHTYPPQDDHSGEIYIASVRIAGVPTQWYRCGANDPQAEVVEITEAEAEESERSFPRAA